MHQHGLVFLPGPRTAHGKVDRPIFHLHRGLAAGVMFVVAQFPAAKLSKLALPLYTIGVALLVATALFGLTNKGATVSYTASAAANTKMAVE